MSTEILRKSLRLFEDDTESFGDHMMVRGKEPLRGTHKKGVKRNEKKLKDTKSHASKSKLKKVGSAIEEYNLQKQRDKTEENLCYLTHISEKAQMNEAVAKTILDHSRKQRSTNTSTDKKAREGTVFTDRDFDQFEEEYEFFS